MILKYIMLPKDSPTYILMIANHNKYTNGNKSS